MAFVYDKYSNPQNFIKRMTSSEMLDELANFPLSFTDEQIRDLIRSFNSEEGYCYRDYGRDTFFNNLSRSAKTLRLSGYQDNEISLILSKGISYFDETLPFKIFFIDKYLNQKDNVLFNYPNFIFGNIKETYARCRYAKDNNNSDFLTILGPASKFIEAYNISPKQLMESYPLTLEKLNFIANVIKYEAMSKATKNCDKRPNEVKK